MRIARLVALAALASALGSAACGATPTEPQRLPFTGQWAGEIAITDCRVTGTYRQCGVFEPGTRHPVWLGLKQDGRAVSGIGGYGSAQYANDFDVPRALWRAYYRPFTGSVADDGILRFNFTLGQAPGVVNTHAFAIRVDGAGVMSGTLEARVYWYKVAGDYTFAGPITLTRVSR